MIVPMKKVAVIVRAQDAADTVGGLASLGLLHVEHAQPPQSKDVLNLEEEIALIDSALLILQEAAAKEERKQQINPLFAGRKTYQHIIDLWKRYSHLEEYSGVLWHAFNEWRDWGDFDPQEILQLRRQGLAIKLLLVPQKQLQQFPDGVCVKNIFTSAGLAHCLAISRDDFSVPFKEVDLPKQSLSAIKARLEENTKAMQVIKHELQGCRDFSPSLLAQKKRLEEEREFQQALAGMAKEGELTYIMGYIPQDVAGVFASEAKKKKWGVLITDPAQEDNVPIKLAGGRWVKLIRPLFKFLEILPGYRELDISLPFLLFFSVFFGILIGDAGYGLVYILITFLLQQKLLRQGKDTGSFTLFYILSFSAIIWGILTGTFFGHEWVLKAGYKPLVPALVDEKGLQGFCFFLGALHLSIAHAWRATLKAPSLAALADLGWISLLWSAFFLAKTLILSDPFPALGKWLIICGVSSVILFTSPQKNMLKAAGQGLGALALSLMNTFTDVVSYVRLFAVGLAGVAIADAFNAMAGMLGKDNIFLLLAGLIIVLIGNTLAIVLGPVSVLVHGVRLNVLEFSGHANVSWSGVSYKPLKKD